MGVIHAWKVFDSKDTNTCVDLTDATEEI